jgi:DNA-binding protein H-NS
MARPKSLATLSFDALVKLRDDVSDMLSSQVEAMQEQLARFTGTGAGHGGKRGPKPKASKLKGRKAAVKYRDQEGNKWSGRGAQPRWMTAAIKAGAKRDDFLVGKAARAAKSAKTVKSAKAAKSAKTAKSAKQAKSAKPAKKRKVSRKRVVQRTPKVSVSPAPDKSPEA